VVDYYVVQCMLKRKEMSLRVKGASKKSMLGSKRGL